MTHKHQCEHPELHLNQPVYYQDVAKKTWALGNIIGVVSNEATEVAEVKTQVTGLLININSLLDINCGTLPNLDRILDRMYRS